MRLSIWDIYHALEYDNTMPVIKAGSPTIRTARLISSQELSDDIVYVSSARSFFGTDADDTLIIHGSDLVFVRGHSVEEVFNDVCDILDRFHNWKRTINSLITSENGLQDMLDASESVLRAPAFVYAPDGRAYALSRNYGPLTHWHWAEIIANHGITSERIRKLRDSINLPEVWKDTYPHTRRSAMGRHAYMHCSLKPNGYMAGHFVLFGFEKPFYRGLERIVDVLVKAMTKHMERFYWLYNPTSQLTDAMASFFEDGTFDEGEISLMLRALNWDPEDSYRVIAVRERGAQEPVLLSKLRNDVTRLLPFAIALIVENDLVIVENASRSAENGEVAKQLVPLLKSDFACGVSVIGGDIRQCRTLLRQARHEASSCIATDAMQSFADEQRNARMAEALRRDDLIATYAHPALVQLKKYDAENATSLYESLRAYVMCSFHLSDAARALNLHRNSLDYRLKRIREIVDLSDIDAIAVEPNEQQLMFLMLSFAVLDAQVAG